MNEQAQEMEELSGLEEEAGDGLAGEEEIVTEEETELEEGLTLEKFEEASEVVKNVTLETKLVFSEYLSG